MRDKLDRFIIEKIVIHDIPKKYSKRKLREDPELEIEEPIFSEIPSALNSEITRFFHDKIVSVTGSSSAVDVIFDPDCDRKVKELVGRYFNDRNHLVQITQEIGQFLFEIQDAKNSAGLLLFVEGKIEDSNVLALLKLEKEEGVQLKEQSGANAQLTFDVEYIRNLMLTDKTKLFKIVMFYKDDGEIKGILCDQQRGYKNGEVAAFFIHSFLGCKLTIDSQIITTKFYEATQEFVNSKVESSERRGAIITHLISELTSQSGEINLSNFARNYLEVDKRDEYISFLHDKGVESGSFIKDTSLIESKIKKIQYSFESGIRVYGTQQAFNDNVITNDSKDGKLNLKIEDYLQGVKTR